jgi:hypothetical protein
MATPEFRETGQTQNQKLRAMNSDKPPAPVGDARADAVVKRMMEQSPALANFTRPQAAAPTPPQAPPQSPTPDPYADLTSEELTLIYRRVAGNQHRLDSGTAAALTRALGR